MSLKKFNLLNDIYYSKEYISLYLKDNEEIFEFEYKEDNFIFYNIAIKRPITKIGNVDIMDGYFDLETAYGYGGFYTNSNDELFIKTAIFEYEKQCNKENIIAEFIRFHPFNNFPKRYSQFLDFNASNGDVVIKDLSVDLFDSYLKKTRHTIKRSLEKVAFKESNNIEKFIELYNNTMLKNNAEEFYFFNEYYYTNLINLKNVKLYEVIFGGKIIAMGFFILSENIAHYHLSANTPLSYKLNSNYALLHYIFQTAKDLDICYLILGGGTTSSKNDPLLKFKKKFSEKTEQFYIGGKIYNEKIYYKYNKIWLKQSNEDAKYFLKYRLKMK